ncbi:hypothetical protein [Legionella tunisiensis]|uniref:hypothetical protein n=1 Tax=Legionella tunisiensis TaxID=1034944 RepID=UPI0002E3BF8A|nr:hypothetical protein [Legionella tunisiensis]
MNPLLPFIKIRRELGFMEKFPDSRMTVATALEGLFNKLVTALSPPETPPASIVFSADSFDESLAELEVHQEDVFIGQLALYKNRPNVKICHMRHYATRDAAHWHALFAETDHEGNVIRIIATDSRIDSKSQGITAQRDITKYSLSHRLNITFIAGGQQPMGIKICWLHALANLASLAASGKVYKQQTSNLGTELSELIEKRKKRRAFFSH